MALNPTARQASLRDFAARYITAWCSQHAASVAAFPDLVVTMDDLIEDGTGSSGA